MFRPVPRPRHHPGSILSSWRPAVSRGDPVIPAHGIFDADPAWRRPRPPAAVTVRIPRHRAAHADLPPVRHRHHRRAGHRPGYAMTTAPEITQVELVIGGMTCAACAARVQAKLNKLDGVTASVNLSTERAWVSAPPAVSAPDLIAVVEAAGYTADVAAPPGPDGGA